jgi:hypothetical protein
MPDTKVLSRRHALGLLGLTAAAYLTPTAMTISDAEAQGYPRRTRRRTFRAFRTRRRTRLFRTRRRTRPFRTDTRRRFFRRERTRTRIRARTRRY